MRKLLRQERTMTDAERAIWWTSAIRRRSSEEANFTHSQQPGQPWQPRYQQESEEHAEG